MLDRAARHLATGTSVVLDASFAHAQNRREARSLAIDTASDLTEFCCVLDATVAAARIRHRNDHEHDASDATPEIAEAVAAAFDPWPEVIELSTAAPLPAVTEHAVLALTRTNAFPHAVTCR